MGLKQREGSGARYVKIKDGKFYFSKDETNTPYDELEGKLTNLYFKDEEFEGQPVRKLYLTLSDGKDNYIVGFPFDSAWTSTFLSFLMNADIQEAISLHPMMKTEVTKDATGKTKEVKRRTLLVSQNGTFMKSFFTRDNPNGLPAMQKVKFNGKETWDKTAVLEFYENLIENKLKPQLPKLNEGRAVTMEEAPEMADTSEVDDLPF